MEMPERQGRSLDEAFYALSHIQRRTLLVALLSHNPQSDSPIAVGSDEAGESLERLVEMRHVHLPKLEESGFIRWDRDANEVSTGPNFEEIRPLLELLDEHAEELPEGWL